MRGGEIAAAFTSAQKFVRLTQSTKCIILEVSLKAPKARSFGPFQTLEELMFDPHQNGLGGDLKSN